MKSTLFSKAICIRLLLSVLFIGISGNQTEEECVGTQSFTFTFDGPDYDVTDFVSWHFKDVNTQVEITLATFINGEFQVKADQFIDRLTLPQVGKAAIKITDLEVADSGTYRVVIGAGNTPGIDLKVTDPCLIMDADSLTCVTKIPNSSPITWKEDGNVIPGETDMTISNLCEEGDNGVKNFMCQLSGGQNAQLNITCRHAIPDQEASSNKGAIIGGVVAGVVVVIIIVVIVVIVVRKRGSGYHAPKII